MHDDVRTVVDTRVDMRLKVLPRRAYERRSGSDRGKSTSSLESFAGGAAEVGRGANVGPRGSTLM